MSVKVLIVDDNPNMSSLLAEMLEVFDCESVRAGDGPEAIEKIDTDDFDLVITDMRMPKMSGLDLLKTIKEKKPEMPVVVISGYALDEEGNGRDSANVEAADCIFPAYEETVEEGNARFPVGLYVLAYQIDSEDIATMGQPFIGEEVAIFNGRPDHIEVSAQISA